VKLTERCTRGIGSSNPVWREAVITLSAGRIKPSPSQTPRRMRRIIVAFLRSETTLRRASIARPNREIVAIIKKSTGLSGIILSRRDKKLPAAAVKRKVSK
jgi:hypothetical protein